MFHHTGGLPWLSSPAKVHMLHGIRTTSIRKVSILKVCALQCGGSKSGDVFVLEVMLALSANASKEELLVK